jgi:hypothetical protein
MHAVEVKNEDEASLLGRNSASKRQNTFVRVISVINLRNEIELTDALFELESGIICTSNNPRSRLH